MKLWPRLTVLLLLALVLVACGSGGSGGVAQNAESAKDYGPAEKPAAPAPAPAAPAPAQGTMSSQAKPAQPGAAGAGSAAGAGALPENLDRKIIMNAELDLKVKNADVAIEQIGTAVRQAGGYVQETRQSGTRQQGRTTHMVMRVPAGSYGNILALLAGVGEEILNRREWTSDVTVEYLDLEARIATKETHLGQLQKLYAKGGTIKEMMELEQEIARVTADLESLKGRFRYLSNQVSFSTITAKFYEPGAPTPIKPPGTVWERMKLGFQESWSGVMNFTGNLAVFLAAALPILAYAAVFGGVGYVAYRSLRRFWRRPPAA